MVKRPLLLLFVFLLANSLYSQYPEISGDVIFLQSDWKGLPSVIVNDDFNLYKFENKRFVKKQTLPLKGSYKSFQDRNTIIVTDGDKIGIIHEVNWIDYTAMISPLVNIGEIINVYCRNKEEWSILTPDFILNFAYGRLTKELIPKEAQDLLGIGFNDSDQCFIYSEESIYDLKNEKWTKVFSSEDEIIAVRKITETYYVHTEERLICLVSGTPVTLIQDEIKEGYVLFERLYAVSNNDLIRIYSDSTQVEMITFDNDITGLSNGVRGNLLAISDEQVEVIPAKYIYDFYEDWLIQSLKRVEEEYRYNDYMNILKTAIEDFYIDKSNYQLVIRKAVSDLYWNKKYDSSIKLQEKLKSLSGEDLELLSNNYYQIGDLERSAQALIQKYQLTHDAASISNAFYFALRTKNVELQNNITENLINSKDVSLHDFGQAYRNFLQTSKYDVNIDLIVLGLSPEYIKAELLTFRHVALNRQWLYRQVENYSYSETAIKKQMQFAGGFEDKLYFYDENILYESTEDKEIKLGINKGETLRNLLVNPTGELWRHVETGKYQLIQNENNGKWLMPKNCRFRKNDLTVFRANGTFYGISGNKLYKFEKGRRIVVLNLPKDLAKDLRKGRLFIDNSSIVAVGIDNHIQWYDKSRKSWHSFTYDWSLPNVNIETFGEYCQIGEKLFWIRKSRGGDLDIQFIANISDFSERQGYSISVFENELILQKEDDEEVRFSQNIWKRGESWTEVFFADDSTISLINNESIGNLVFDEDLYNLGKLIKLSTITGKNNSAHRFPDIISIAKDHNLKYLLPDEAELLENCFKNITDGDFKIAVESLTALKISSSQKDWIDISYFLAVLEGLQMNNQYIDAISWLSRMWQWFPRQKSIQWFDPLWSDIVLNGNDKEVLLLIDFIHRQAKVHPGLSTQLDNIIHTIDHIVFVQGKVKAHKQIQSHFRKKSIEQNRSMTISDLHKDRN